MHLLSLSMCMHSQRPLSQLSPSLSICSLSMPTLSQRPLSQVSPPPTLKFLSICNSLATLTLSQCPELFQCPLMQCSTSFLNMLSQCLLFQCIPSCNASSRNTVPCPNASSLISLSPSPLPVLSMLSHSMLFLSPKAHRPNIQLLLKVQLSLNALPAPSHSLPLSCMLPLSQCALSLSLSLSLNTLSLLLPPPNLSPFLS